MDYIEKKISSSDASISLEYEKLGQLFEKKYANFAFIDYKSFCIKLILIISFDKTNCLCMILHYV